MDVNARQLRLVRAASVSSAATLIAAISHTWGGGSAPHPLLVVAVATLLTPLSALFVGVRQSRTRVAVAIVLSQAAFHLLFQMLGSPTGSGTAGRVGHAHHIDLGLLGPSTPAAAPGTIMLLAHVVAALLTTLLVWYGEAAVRVVARWVEALFRHAAAIAPAEHRRPTRLRSTTFFSFDAGVSAAAPRRGPPALVRD